MPAWYTCNFTKKTRSAASRRFSSNSLGAFRVSGTGAAVAERGLPLPSKARIPSANHPMAAILHLMVNMACYEPSGRRGTDGIDDCWPLLERTGRKRSTFFANCTRDEAFSLTRDGCRDEIGAWR